MFVRIKSVKSGREVVKEIETLNHHHCWKMCALFVKENKSGKKLHYLFTLFVYFKTTRHLNKFYIEGFSLLSL